MANLFHLAILSVSLVSFTGLPNLISDESNPSETISYPVNDKEENEEIIPWSARRDLTWDDFLSQPQKNTDAVASTSTSLGIAYQVRNGVLNYEVTCNFSKVKSWGLLKTDYILAHEQGHFDITEIYARKLNQMLQHYKFNRKTYKQDINRIYQTVVAEKEAMQHAYDGETDHSRKRRRQNEWLNRIENMLNDSHPYATYP